MEPVTPEELLDIYRSGYFPMAEDRDSPELYWFQPEERGVLPLHPFKVPHGMKKLLQEEPFETRVNAGFEAVIRACAELNATRRETWINDRIISLYCELHAMGYAHSVESWQDGRLVGGLYGVSIGGAFCGESMFTREAGASKFALVRLAELLEEAGYQLLDTQYVNDHLKQFGVQAVSNELYQARLDKALRVSPNPSEYFCTVAERRGWLASSSNSYKRASS